MISVAHWGRLEDGELFARTRYIEWAVMMKRTWGFDVLSCPTCARKMRVVATITQPDVVRKILVHLGVRSTPLPRAPARDPPLEQTALGFDTGADAA
jgi:voltage-gated potassium channel Kch